MLNLSEKTALITPNELKSSHPITEQAKSTVRYYREQLFDILNGNDKRLVVIVGPCSIHNIDAAIAYATKLKKCINNYKDNLCIIMRTYLEKPRTITGWKGLINDPDLNKNFNINKGFGLAREVLIKINSLGVPTGSEILNPLSAPYILDLLSWSVIGARTVESQIHRELASNLPLPVGFKNSTTGNIQVAMDGMQTANQSHHFLSVCDNGNICAVTSTGNPYCHIVLRGSHQATNYDDQTFKNTLSALRSRNLSEQIMIDCSHGNSQKDHLQQIKVVEYLCDQISKSQHMPFGIMLESNLISGKQHLTNTISLTYGQSITDACIGWDETEILLQKINDAVKKQKSMQK